MTNEQLNAIVEAAKARQDEITPAWTSQYSEYPDEAWGKYLRIQGAVPNREVWVYGLEDSPVAINDLITAAPDLNEAVIALAARVEALEAMMRDAKDNAARLAAGLCMYTQSSSVQRHANKLLKSMDMNEIIWEDNQP